MLKKVIKSFKDRIKRVNMEYSDDDDIETKTFTIPVKLLSDIEGLSEDGIADRLSELVLEFYEDGQFAYSPYHSKNKNVPESHRKKKASIKKFIKSLEMPKYCPQAFKGKVLSSFFHILLNTDNQIVPHLIERNAEIRKKSKEKTKELNEIKPLYEDLKKNFDKMVQEKIDEAIENRLEDIMCEEREHSRDKLKQRLNIINRLEKENEKLKHYHTLDEERLISENASLVEELHNVKEELSKYKECKSGNVGRPKLTKKEKKQRKLAKLKKQMKELESSSESETSSDSDSD